MFPFLYFSFNPIRPARSKHCSYCSSCISRYDHHCFLLNNCIGGYNNMYYLVFLHIHIIITFYSTYISKYTHTQKIKIK